MFYGLNISVCILAALRLSSQADNVKYMVQDRQNGQGGRSESTIEDNVKYMVQDRQDERSQSKLWRQTHVGDHQAGDIGNATNCDPHNPKAEFHWSPLVFDPTSPVTLWIKHFTTQVSFDSGIFRAELWVPERTDNPILAYSYPVACKDFREEFYLNCPIQKHLPLPDLRYTVQYNEIGPSGNFSVKFELKNERKETMFCFKFPVQIKEFDW